MAAPNVEVVGKYLSTLPEDDDHPYRTGPWRPQTTEWDADDLIAVEGEIPHDLDGVYLRNTENPLHPALKFYHPFDGDGMIHVVGFRDGKAFYRNRFIRTDGFAEENEAGGPLWPGLAEPVQTRQARQGLGCKDIDEGRVEHRRHRAPRHGADELLPVRRPVPSRPVSPATRSARSRGAAGSRSTGACRRTRRSTTAPANCCSSTTASEAPYMHYGVVDANDDLVHYVDVPLPGPRLPHDMAFTENYVILNDFPLFWDPKLLAAGVHLPGFHRDMPSRFAVIPRRGGSDEIRWFEADPTFVLHFTNAYEDGDEIVLDGFFEGDPSPVDTLTGDKYKKAFRYLALDGMQTRLHRWRFNLVTGQTTGGAAVRLHHRVRHDQRRPRRHRLPLRLRRDRQARAGSCSTAWSNTTCRPAPRNASRSPTASTAARRRWRRASAASARTTAIWSR